MDKTNKTPLEEMLDKEYPLTNKEFRGYYRDKRETFMKGYSFCLSSIKQEQKPSDGELPTIDKIKAVLYETAKKQETSDGIIVSWNFESQAKAVLELFTFASPSKEIDWSALDHSMGLWAANFKNTHGHYPSWTVCLKWIKQRPEFSNAQTE